MWAKFRLLSFFFFENRLHKILIYSFRSILIGADNVRKKHGIMWEADAFLQLDTSKPIPLVYTIGCRFLPENEPDIWAERFLNFKDSKKKDAPDFIGCKKILRDAVIELIEHHKLDKDKVGLATALSHNQTESNLGSVLFWAGEWISDEVGIKWEHDSLKKDKHERLRSAKRPRDEIMEETYTCTKFNGLSCIFILDDFITQGSTLAEIYRACLASNPSVKVIALALAKHVRSGDSKINGVDNSRIPEEWESYWTEGNK